VEIDGPSLELRDDGSFGGLGSGDGKRDFVPVFACEVGNACLIADFERVVVASAGRAQSIMRNERNTTHDYC